MATATPGPTPNPDAMRFQLDVTLPETMNFTSADAAGGDAFAAAVVVRRLLARGRLAECDAAVLGRHPEHCPVHEPAARRVAVDHQQRELLGVRGHARPLEGGRDVVAVAGVEAGETGGVDDVRSRELHRLGR